MEEGKQFEPLAKGEYEKLEGITPEVEIAHDQKVLPSLEQVMGSLELIAEATLGHEAESHELHQESGVYDDDPVVDTEMRVLVGKINECIDRLAHYIDTMPDLSSALIDYRTQIVAWRDVVIDRVFTEEWAKRSQDEKLMVIRGAMQNVNDLLEKYIK